MRYLAYLGRSKVLNFALVVPIHMLDDTWFSANAKITLDDGLAMPYLSIEKQRSGAIKRQVQIVFLD